MPDYFVPTDEFVGESNALCPRNNIIELCLDRSIFFWSSVITLLLDAVPNYKRNENKSKYSRSLLQLAFESKNSAKHWKLLIEIRYSQNPIAAFLRSAVYSGEAEILELIMANYDFEDVLEQDFKMIQNFKLTKTYNVQRNLSCLRDFCLLHDVTSDF